MNTIAPIEIVDNPTDPYRIVCMLEELRRVWDKEPKRTLGEILRQILKSEWDGYEIYSITDDEIVAAIQNYEPLLVK